MTIARLLLCLLVLTGLAAKAQAVTDAQTIFTEASSQVYTDTDKALKSADYLLQNAADNDEKANALWLQSEIYSLKGQYLKAVDLLFEAKAVAEKKDTKTKILAAIALQCQLAGLTDKAKSYTEEATLKNNLKSAADANRGEILQLVAQQKDPAATIKNITSILPQLQKSQDVQLKAIVYKNLANSYFTLNDTENYKAYNQQFDTLNELLTEQKDKARIALLSHIDKDYEALQDAQAKEYTTAIYVGGGIFLFLGFVGCIYILGQRKDYRQYQKILAGLETPEMVKPAEAIVPETKVYSMPEKTEKGLLDKLARFEESGKFINNNISLNGLAKQLDTNTKYLSEIINTHKCGNFNAYINELRVKYILKKLQSDPVYLNYKVSYLAEESGFSSHSAFATVFKAVTGISPTTYISFLKKETENVLNQQPVNSHAS
jgi:YesN/AraC family two-component response regulator